MSNLGFTPAQTAAGVSDTGALAVQGVTGGVPQSVLASLGVGSGTLALGTVGSTLAIVNTGYATARVAIAGLTAGGGTISFTAQDAATSAAYVLGAISGAANARATSVTADGSNTFNIAGRNRIILTVTVAAAAAASATVAWSLGQAAGLVTLDTSPAGPAYVSDIQSMAYQGVVAITPGTATTPQRSLGYICTTAGQVTLTLANGSTIALGLTASPSLQTLPFAVTNVALGTGTAGTFWGLV